MNDNFYRISDMYQRLITCFGLLLIVSSLFVRATEPVHDVPVKIRIADFKDAKVGAVSYTFDDGLRNQYLIAAPILLFAKCIAAGYVLFCAHKRVPEKRPLLSKRGRHELGAACGSQVAGFTEKFFRSRLRFA